MTGQLIGYARVSSIGQSLEIQIDKLKACNKIYQEKKTGANMKRAALIECLDYVREGDTLVITRLDRLGRSTLDLCQIVNSLKQKGVAFKVLDQNIDTTSPMGMMLFHILAAFAEMETAVRKERQMDGIAKAKANGVRLGKEKSLNDITAQELRTKRKDGILIKELMAEYQLSKASVYRYLKEE